MELMMVTTAYIKDRSVVYNIYVPSGQAMGQSTMMLSFVSSFKGQTEIITNLINFWYLLQ